MSDQEEEFSIKRLRDSNGEPLLTEVEDLQIEVKALRKTLSDIDDLFEKQGVTIIELKELFEKHFTK